MMPMPVTGLEKVVEGQTSLDNLIRIVGIESIKQHKDLLISKFFKK